MEFWFLAVVASGLLSWGHFIYSDITDLIAQILFMSRFMDLCAHSVFVYGVDPLVVLVSVA